MEILPNPLKDKSVPSTPERQKKVESSQKFLKRVLLIIILLAQLIIAFIFWVYFQVFLSFIINALFPPPPLCLGIPWDGPTPEFCHFNYVPNPLRSPAQIIAAVIFWLYVPITLWFIYKLNFKKKIKPVKSSSETPPSHV